MGEGARGVLCRRKGPTRHPQGPPNPHDSSGKMVRTPWPWLTGRPSPASWVTPPDPRTALFPQDAGGPQAGPALPRSKVRPWVTASWTRLTGFSAPLLGYQVPKRSISPSHRTTAPTWTLHASQIQPQRSRLGGDGVGLGSCQDQTWPRKRKGEPGGGLGLRCPWLTSDPGPRDGGPMSWAAGSSKAGEGGLGAEDGRRVQGGTSPTVRCRAVSDPPLPQLDLPLDEKLHLLAHSFILSSNECPPRPH